MRADRLSHPYAVCSSVTAYTVHSMMKKPHARMPSQQGFLPMALKLVIGNKNYSSWSMRPWLALRANDIGFDEVFIPLYTGDADKKRILGFTRSGKVPALI